MFTVQNTFFMRRCFDIARLANPVSTSPNPAVGAVIVAPDGRIIGKDLRSLMVVVTER